MNQRQSFARQSGGETRHFEFSLDISAEQLDRMTVHELVELAKTDQGEAAREELIDLARWLYDGRRARDRHLTSSLLGEPVWDMLLALYCLPPRGEQLSVSSLCYAAGVPQTTALRWIQLMEERDLVERHRDPADARRTHVTLSREGERVMTACLQRLYADRPR
jgi:DNA-binding MarR family transcriptional regulator